nr:putative nadp-dependent mannitol dehydrogenase [Quercus suber]
MSSQAVSKNIQTTPVLEQFSLAGKVAVVTGGARGIGLHVVHALAEAGADVAIVYWTTTQAPEIAKACSRSTGRQVKAYRADVRSREAITNTLETIATDFGNGRLDIVVANAGVCTAMSALDYTEETWARDNQVNYDGAFWTAQAAGRIFKRQGGGNLVITASVSSRLVNVPQRQAAYNASKAAVAHLTRCLAVEWAGFARVNCISPGYVQTESKLAHLSLRVRASSSADSPPVITKQPTSLVDNWLTMIPTRRLARPEELKAVSSQEHVCRIVHAKLINCRARLMSS